MKVPSSKTLEFKTKITGKVFALSVLPLGCAVLLLHFALDAAKKFSSNDPTRLPFIGIPMLLAILLVVVIGMTLHHFLGREVKIEDDYLVYKDAKHELHLEITKMAYSPPLSGGLLKLLMFSDGETFIQIPEIFLGDMAFAQLAEAIGSRRRRNRMAGGDTYTL